MIIFFLLFSVVALAPLMVGIIQVHYKSLLDWWDIHPPLKVRAWQAPGLLLHPALQLNPYKLQVLPSTVG
jgi:hypothetical protein